MSFGKDARVYGFEKQYTSGQSKIKLYSWQRTCSL